MPIESKLEEEEEEEEDGGGDITCIGKNRLRLEFHHRSFPILDKAKKKKKKRKSLFVKILSACQGCIFFIFKKKPRAYMSNENREIFFF
jgi:hypothetical protein